MYNPASTLQSTPSRAPLLQVERELGVRRLVDGSVQVDGARLRVNVRLIGAASGAHLLAERYDRTLDDAFGVQSDVARQIVAALGARLGAAEQREMAESPTMSAQAYRLYLQGLTALVYTEVPCRERTRRELARIRNRASACRHAGRAPSNRCSTSS